MNFPGYMVSARKGAHPIPKENAAINWQTSAPPSGLLFLRH